MALTKIKTGSVSDSITLTTPTISGVLTANAGVVVDNFTLDGTTLALSSGNMALDSAGHILLDADSGEIAFQDSGTTFLEIANSSSNAIIRPTVQDKDILFNGNDGGAAITALTLDMSAAGAATFNSTVSGTIATFSGDVNARNFTGVDDGNTYINFPGSDIIKFHTAGLSRFQLAADGSSSFLAPNMNITADDARLLIEEADGTNMVWLGDLTGAGVGGCFLYNHGGTAVVQLRSDSASTIGHGLTVGGTVHASQTYAAPTNGISADTVGIFSKNNTANGNANVSVLSRSSGEARLYLGDETDENKWAITSKSYGGGLCFESAGTTRMTIDTAGTIQSQYGTSTGYSQTSGYGGMNYQNDNGSTGGALILTTNADRGWSNMYLNKFNWASGKDVRSIQFTVNGGVVGTIGTTSTATAYNTSSDYRLKENVVPMTGSIDRLKALKPSQFNFIVDSDTTVDGFLAHEAQAVVPECVTGTKDAMRDEEYEVTAAVEEVRDEDDNVTTEAAEAVMGTRSVPDMQGIDQSKLVPLLVAALQEAIARIEILEGA